MGLLTLWVVYSLFFVCFLSMFTCFDDLGISGWIGNCVFLNVYSLVVVYFMVVGLNGLRLLVFASAC